MWNFERAARWACGAVCFSIAGAATAQAPSYYPASYASLIAEAKKEGAVTLYTNTLPSAVVQLQRAFESQYPGVRLLAPSLGSDELFTKFSAEAAAKSPVADVVFSSAMDQQAVFLSQGLGMKYDSPEAKFVPSSGPWVGIAYPVTLEPIVLIYNKNVISEAAVPKSHKEFVAFLHTPGADGKVGTFDVRASGVGYFFFTESPYTVPSLTDVAAGLGKAHAKFFATTASILERVQSGELGVAYNVHGSYGLATVKKDPSLGMIYPSDFIAAFERTAFVYKDAPHPAAAKLLLDFLLSSKGQELLRQASLYPIRSDLSGEGTATDLREKFGSHLKPIPMDASLLKTMNPVTRLAFLRSWAKAVSGQN